MTRLTLLAILVVWMSWSKQAFGPPDPAGLSPTVSLSIFASGYLVLVIALRGWAILAARRSARGMAGSLFRFQRVVHFSRFFIPVWLGVGVYLLDWGPAVELLTHRLYAWPSGALHLEFPQAMLGILPAMLAWVGLWWAEFPVDFAVREQSALANLEDDLPVHAPQTFRQTFSANFRLQILFTLVPIICLLVLHDLVVAACGLFHVASTYHLEDWVMFPGTLVVLLLAPELLRRTLHTERLADSPLRRRLEAMCRSVGLKYRDILLWRTNDTMGNAAVMGLLPRVRYVLLSDLLLETMTDEQIEAVFAHELGHVVHKHLLWFGAFFALTVVFMGGPGQFALDHLKTWYLTHWSARNWEQVEGLAAGLVSFGAFVLAFGYLSPKFERQADVYAARSIEPDGVVTERGAALIASALNRVAAINHIPVSARNWSHGSIATRVRAVMAMSASPDHTRRFDRFMNRHYAGLVALILAFGAWMCVSAFTARPVNGSTAVGPSPAAGAAR